MASKGVLAALAARPSSVASMTCDAARGATFADAAIALQTLGRSFFNGGCKWPEETRIA
jgi:hypothetical protein